MIAAQRPHCFYTATVYYDMSFDAESNIQLRQFVHFPLVFFKLINPRIVSIRNHYVHVHALLYCTKVDLHSTTCPAVFNGYWCRWQHYMLFPDHTVTHFPPRTFTFAVPANMQANGFVSLWKLTWFNLFRSSPHLPSPQSHRKLFWQLYNEHFDAPATHNANRQKEIKVVCLQVDP